MSFPHPPQRETVDFHPEPPVKHIERSYRPIMAQQIFLTFSGSDVTDSMLKEAASLFNANYGIWGADPTNSQPTPKPGKFFEYHYSYYHKCLMARIGSRVKLSKYRLRSQCLPENADCSYKSNHTGYRRVQGRRTSPEEITALYAGLKAACLTDFDVLLDRQQQRPGGSFFWVLDPVMGDQGRLYVAEDVFEAELLTGRPTGSVRTLADVVGVVGDLHALGVPHVIVTSVRLQGEEEREAQAGSSRTMVVAGSSRKSDGSSRVWTVEVPVLDCFFSGTGDMFAALMVARLREAAQAHGLLHTPSWMPPDAVPANETPLAKAAEKVLSSMQTVLEKTIAARDQELARADDLATRKYLALTKASEIRLVRNWTDLVAPTVRFPAQTIQLDQR
ncbi:hypothetical protein DV735_g530, partial [Chaetothyriales sp. CBS 134920]